MVNVRGVARTSRPKSVQSRRTAAAGYNKSRTIRTQQQAQTRRRNKGFDPNRAPDGEGWQQRRRMKTDGPDVPYWFKSKAPSRDRARFF